MTQNYEKEIRLKDKMIPHGRKVVTLTSSLKRCGLSCSGMGRKKRMKARSASSRSSAVISSPPFST